MTDDRSVGAGDSPRPRNSAGAWAAAALVLALGSLVFVVIAHIRITDLEGRIDSLEATRSDQQVAARLPTTSAPGPTTPPTPAPERQVPEQPESAGPPDAPAARAAVVEAFRAVYDGGTGEERARHVDDPAGIAAAVETVRAGSNRAAVEAATVDVQQVRFVSDTEASVVYGVAVSGQTVLAARQGAARLVEGEWKVLRATVCQDLQSVGGAC